MHCSTEAANASADVSHSPSLASEREEGVGAATS